MSLTLQNDTPVHLHHFAIDSTAPTALAAFYRQMLDCEDVESAEGHRLVGPQRALLVQRGAENRPRYLAYAVHQPADLERLRLRLSERSVTCDPLADPLFRPGAFVIVDPQGRRVAFGVSALDRPMRGAAARLQHCVFQTTDLEKIVRFYVEQVGFAVSDWVLDDASRPMVVFMRSDDEHHTLAFFRGSQNAWDHHCYETPDWNGIRDWGDRFARAEVPIFFGPGRHGPGNNLFFMVTDPDGNHLEFSAELERVESNKPAGTWPHSERTLNLWGRAWIRT